MYRAQNGKLEAIMAYSNNPVHPHAQGFSAYVPNYSVHIYQSILKDVVTIAQRNNCDRIATLQYLPLTAFERWLLNNQFSCWRETVMPSVLLDKIQLAELSIKQGQHLLTLRQIKQSDYWWKTLIKKSHEDYVASHLVNPMIKMADSNWAANTNDALMDIPVALVTGDQILSYTYSFEDLPNVLTFSWFGGTSTANLWILQAEQIQWAIEHHFKKLSGEFDNSDPLAWSTYRHWPFEPAPVLTTLGRKFTIEKN
ncbi:hypothetical protein R5P91_05515 [Oenococcus oeni]|nr:hypothetical protein [Oenococcus oeni]